MSWYDFATSYIDMKWKDASAKHRADIARVLMLVTLRLFSTERSKPADEALRRALSRWGFNTKQRPTAAPGIAEVLRWVARNTRDVDVLADSETLRGVLDAVTTRRDGKRMAPVTTKKYRAILHNALEYAVVRKALSENPLTGIKWIPVRTSSEVDRRSVVNPAQGRACSRRCESRSQAGHDWWRSTAQCSIAGYAPKRRSKSSSTT